MSSQPQAPAASRAAAADADLAYKMQKWPRFLFKQECAEGGFINEAVNARKEGTWPAVCRELYGRLYGTGTSKLDEVAAGNEWAEQLHQQADAVPEWKNLEDQVRGDSWRAALGAGQVAMVLSQHMPEMPEENAGALQAESDMMREIMDSAGKVNTNLLQQRGELQKRIAAARNTAEKASQSMQAAQGFATRSALRKAAQQATQAIEDVDNGLVGMGCGNQATAAEKRALSVKLANDDRLRRIANLAGRLRIQAARKQRTKVTQERSEIISIKLGDDLRHLVASEIGQLSLPQSRPFVLERISEKRALQYELGGKSTKVRGPIVFLIDNSGSMGGKRNEWAVGAGMAMMEVARIQRRGFVVAFFDAGIKFARYFAVGEATLEKLLEVMSVEPRGGTVIANALAFAVQVITGKLEEAKAWKDTRNADVVLLTDGEDNSDITTPALALKEAGASIYTIAIECAPTEALKNVSVDAVALNGSDMNGASRKLDTVFSM